MDTSSAPTHEEMKKYLKDAGMYEKNMSYDDVLNYYNVIKCSESTAQEEQVKRDESIVNTDEVKSKTGSSPNINLDDDIEDDIVCKSPAVSPKLNKKLITPKTKSKLSLLRTEEVLSAQSNSNLENEEDIDADVLNPPLKHKPLDIIIYERKYDLPPYCNPKYNKLSISQRAKIICSFHKTVLEKFYKLHCESINPAPWGRPITASEKFSSTLDRKSQSAEDAFDFMLTNDEDSLNNLEIYTSRSGRQTKRKVYIDEYDEDNEFKKSKRDEDKPFHIEKKPVGKKQNVNKLSNQDIMKRSKLFGDLPKSTRAEKSFDQSNQDIKRPKLFGEPPKSTRAEILFDQLKNDEKSTVTNEIEIVNDNIDPLGDNVDVIPNSPNNDDMEIEPKEMPFIRRRIPPPIRGRRGIGPRKMRNSDAEKSNEISSASTSTVTNSQNSPVPNASETKKNSTPGKAKCPICSEIFFQDEIEAHASSCGLLMEPETTFDTSLRNGTVTKIKCHICDREMIMNTEYEVHVKDCIRKTKENSSA